MFHELSQARGRHDGRPDAQAAHRPARRSGSRDRGHPGRQGRAGDDGLRPAARRTPAAARHPAPDRRHRCPRRSCTRSSRPARSSSSMSSPIPTRKASSASPSTPSRASCRRPRSSWRPPPPTTTSPSTPRQTESCSIRRLVSGHDLSCLARGVVRDSTARVPPLIRLIALALCAVVLTACHLDVTVDVAMQPDGTGTVTLVATADAELVAQVPDLVDDLRLDDAVANGWVVERSGGHRRRRMTITLTHPFASADELASVLNSIGPPLTNMQAARNHRSSRSRRRDHQRHRRHAGARQRLRLVRRR